MNAKRKRVKAYVDAISELLMDPEPSRERAAELVRKHLESEGVEPFRGASKPDDIFEKELISLYIVGVRGLGIRDDYSEIFSKVFDKEERYEEIIKLLTSDLPIEKVREGIKSLIPDMSEGDVARILRFALTLYYLDFEPYEFVVKAIKRMLEALPEFEDTIRRFTKFFVAVKLAEEISSGSIRNKVEKEIRKQLISLETGVPKSTPSDSYVAKIASVTYEIPDKVLSNIFGSRRSSNTNNTSQ